MSTEADRSRRAQMAERLAGRGRKWTCSEAYQMEDVIRVAEWCDFLLNRPSLISLRPGLSSNFPLYLILAPSDSH